jgi:hypothetical protein
MLWICVASALTVIAASASLWGAIDDRRDMKTGHPSFESLASYTGVWDRETLVRILGAPDENDRFPLPPDQIRELPITRLTRLFDSTTADVMSILLAVVAPILWTQNRTLAIGAAATAAGLQAIGYAIAAVVTYRSGIWRKWLRDEQP